jgi:hypothetical protein
MAENYDDRPERPCLGCGKRDKAPRDIVTLPDGNQAFYHWDCHVMVADCDVCKATLAALGTDHTNDGLKDDKLVSAYQKKVEGVPFEKRPEIFRTAAAVPQELPNN